jgi:hypothetical protein
MFHFAPDIRTGTASCGCRMRQSVFAARANSRAHRLTAILTAADKRKYEKIMTTIPFRPGLATIAGPVMASTPHLPSDWAN